MKLKVDSVIEGKYGYDSLLAVVDKESISIAFDKKENIKQYVGKQIELDEKFNIVKNVQHK